MILGFSLYTYYRAKINHIRTQGISPGEDLFFELSLSRTRIVHRITDATDHEVLVTKSENNETRQIQQ